MSLTTNLTSLKMGQYGFLTYAYVLGILGFTLIISWFLNVSCY